MGLWLTDLCEIVAIYLPWVPEDIFFLLTLMVRGETPSTRREAPRGTFSIRKHGLFHIWYFENGPLEPGYHFLGCKHVMRALSIATIT